MSLALILAKKAKQGGEKEDGEEEDAEESMSVTYARDMMRAINDKDEEALASVLAELTGCDD